ncbi:DUF2608 domain-containing protein [Cellulophaga lytica]|nr:DUF2608 domain-containing protein [Cellulophaga lytica]
MTKKKYITLMGITLFISINLTAQTLKNSTIFSFKDVNNLVTQKTKQYGVENVLVIVDIDNTLLTSNVDLGGDIWYNWQRGKIEDAIPTKKQKIENCFYEDVIGLLYELGTMKLTDSLIPKYLKNWQNNGTTVFALTSRSPRYRTATERELLKNGINLSKSPITQIDGSKAVYNYTLEREMSYRDGLMMTTGMNKGDMIAHILGRTGRTYKAIIFVDDSEKNIKDVTHKFKDKTAIDFTVFYFDKIVRDRKIANGGVLITKKQAKKMTADWEKLSKTLNTIFPGRNTKNKCVSPN